MPLLTRRRTPRYDQLMVETEIKLCVPSVPAMRATLKRAGFRILHRRIFEANTVFDTPQATLRSGGRLLRLRECGGKVILTVKGPAKTGRHKSRAEHEVQVSDAATTLRLFAELGYAPTFRYEKYRTEYRRADDPGLAMLDETPIGNFLELEGPGRWIDTTARELGFQRTDYVTSSYGALYLADCERRGVKPGHMVFR